MRWVHIINNSGICGPWELQWRKRIDSSSDPYSLKNRIFSTTTLVEDITATFMKNHTSYQRNLTMITSFGHSWTIRIPMRGKDQSILNQRVSQTKNVFDWSLKAKKVNIWRNGSWNVWKLSNLTAVFRHFWNTKIPTKVTKLISFWTQSSFTVNRLSVENFMFEWKNLVCTNGEFEIQYRRTSKSKRTGFFGQLAIRRKGRSWKIFRERSLCE